MLNGWRGPPDWVAYAQFNLGAAFVRKGLLSDADHFLTAVGTLDTRRSELLALKDRANLALGFAYLQANQAAKAKPALERVRLTGPFSNKALLGLGWADAALGEYRGALRPWLELHNRNLLDAAVQESFLAVPYAYGKLNANAQAAEAYESAIRSFDEETRNLDGCDRQAPQRHMLDDMLANEEQSGRYGWFCNCAASRTRHNRATCTRCSPAMISRRPEELSRPRIHGPHALALDRQHGSLRRHDRHTREGLRRAAAAGRCTAVERCRRQTAETARAARVAT